MTDFQRWCQWLKPFVDAGADGKEIEQENDFGFWIPKASCGFPAGRDYRIKPTPKYRPFTLEESGKLLGRCAVSNGSGLKFEITGITASGTLSLSSPASHTAGRFPSLERVQQDYTFADTGKPCGVLVEDDEQ